MVSENSTNTNHGRSGGDDKRSRILNAATKIFAQNGFYHSKISEIAREAGVADGTIYLYFKNKDDILISVFEENMDTILSQLQQRIAVTDDPLERLRIFVEHHFTLVQEFPYLAQVIQVELRQSNKFMKEYKNVKFAQYLNVIADTVRAGQEQGVIRREIHHGVVKRALFGALDELSLHWVLLGKDDRYDLGESGRQLAELIVNGIATRARPAG